MVRSGRDDEAELALADLTEGAERTGRTWAWAAVHRSRGLLDRGDAAEAHFQAALALHRTTTTPFETARTELCLGEWLRRNHRPGDACDRLQAALWTFEGLGATGWAERAASELRAGGGLRGRSAGCAANGVGLTPQEQRVAETIAAGATNKQAAAALFLSSKTVEFHLSSVYRKLGLTSRTQLARDFALAR